MKKYMILVLILFLLFPKNIKAADEDYILVSKSEKDNITLFAKKIGDMYRDFKIEFKGETYFRLFWMNVTNPTFAPQIFYEDINKDENKDLIIVLNKGYGTGVLDEEVYVYKYTNGLIDEIVDNPLAIIHKNVKTKLTSENAELIIGGNKIYTIDTKSIEQSHLGEDIGFGSIVDYEVIDKKLMVRVSAQVTPAMFIGDILITYGYRDKMYQANKIEFIPYNSTEKNPFLGPLNQSNKFN
ncbi:hypothetical protein CN692_04070 [Bacillus sp. AFS002410]|uniref:hypothetical protein n=1 Tax=Bacillus sp. AFS002410 TaxID=2033481 RepID=UPI000BF045CE|nr:hypothetical protein [Bacillus sp. AFS002410]PEJ59964.1 hypothetical protein CN692_04070 [Bacillus sp. AFS002410]